MTHQRFLITRLSAIGDCILTLPLVCALRRAFPGATIDWAVEKSSASLLEGHDAIDRLHVLPKGWLKSYGEVRTIRRTLRKRRYDCVLDPQGLSRSAILGLLSGAKTRICLKRPAGREIAPLLATRTAHPDSPHVAERQLALLKPLGVQATQVEFRLPRFPDAASTVEQWLAHHSLPRFALINPGAQWPTKLWLPERFAQLARELRHQSGLPSLVAWAPGPERRIAESIVEASAGCARLAPPTSLTELAEMIRRATLFVSSDTGPLHLAVAAGTPSVGLYGPTRPEVCGPYGPPHQAVQAWYQDGSSRRRKRGENFAMRDITVEMALDACYQVLSRAQSHPPPAEALADAS